MSNLQVGQKVVCLETFVSSGRWHGAIEGEVYTIRGFVKAGENICLYLDEIRNHDFDWSHWGYPEIGMAEPAFHSILFRPLIERKTDISIFQAMLTPKQVPVDALVQ